MAKITLQGNPVKVTAPDANDNELIMQIDNARNYGYMKANIKITAGTFRFNVGSEINDNDQPTFTTTDAIIELQVGGDFGTLHFKAAAFGNTFSIWLS